MNQDGRKWKSWSRKKKPNLVAGLWAFYLPPQVLVLHLLVLCHQLPSSQKGRNLLHDGDYSKAFEPKEFKDGVSFLTEGGQYGHAAKVSSLLGKSRLLLVLRISSSPQLRVVSLHLTGAAFLSKQFWDQVVLSWERYDMDAGDTMENCNHKFWDAYLQISLFKKVSLWRLNSGSVGHAWPLKVKLL